MRYDAIRPGSFDTAARLSDLDADGLYAQLLYPSVTLAGARTYSDDRELQCACVRAYNEWLLEFCKPSGGRLVPQAIIPTTGIDDAVAELQWAMAHGHRGALIAAFPSGSYETSAEDDRFWAVAEEAELPLGIHIGSFSETGLQATIAQSTLSFLAHAGGSKAGADSIPAATKVLFSLACERFPRLRFVIVEGNIGWIPTAMEQVDDMFLRYRWYTGASDDDDDDAEPALPPQLLGDVHDRHHRHRAAPPHERRPSDVVDGLPAHRDRLAEQPRDHRPALPRRAEGRGEEDAARQLPGALPPRSHSGSPA